MSRHQRFLRMRRVTGIGNEPGPSMSRRSFLATGVSAMAVSAIGCSVNSQSSTETMPADSGQNNRRILLRGGAVMTMDAALGNLEKGDILIEEKKIVAIGPNLEAGNAAVVNAANRIVLPGFVDTHRHQYSAALRGALADGLVYGDYFPRFGTVNPFFEPEDAYAGELLAAISQLRSGVTTSVDMSQAQRTPEHTDACIKALKDSGRRTVFCYSGGAQGSDVPTRLAQVRSKYFASDDQLLTLAATAGLDEKDWAVARNASLPIFAHVQTAEAAAMLEALGKKGLMRADNTYLHCTHLPDTTWKMIKDTGGHVSLAPPVEMTEGHGRPAIVDALTHGIRPSLAGDIELVMTCDMFTIMRTTYLVQRTQINDRADAGEKQLPPRVTSSDVLGFATIEGARAAYVDKKVGSLTPGKEADIILLRADDLNVLPITNVPGAVVTQMDTSNVDTILVAGKIVMWKGELQGVDMQKIRQMANKTRDGLLARSKFPVDTFKTCCPH